MLVVLFFGFEVLRVGAGSLVYLCVRGRHTHFLKCFERRRVRHYSRGVVLNFFEPRSALNPERRRVTRKLVFETGGVHCRVSSLPSKPGNDFIYRAANLTSCFTVLVPLLTGALFDQPNCRRKGAQQVACALAERRTVHKSSQIGIVRLSECLLDPVDDLPGQSSVVCRSRFFQPRQ